MADLLWFPTGGGKTEAYLGLTAYTLAIRRLQGTIGGCSGEEGVAVIMRYTLRLLTLQQFQRATALICACEILRREDKQRTWGETPFRLGLWVGQRTTPNTTEQSEESSRQDRGQYQQGQYYRWRRLSAPVDQLPMVRFSYRCWPGYQDRTIRQGTRSYVYLLRRSPGPLSIQP